MLAVVFCQLDAENEEALSQSIRLERAGISESAGSRLPADLEHLPWEFAGVR